MAGHAEGLLAVQPDLAAEAREYLLMAAMTGRIAAREPERALALWTAHAGRVRAQAPVFRLLRCHAESAGCAAAFSP